MTDQIKPRLVLCEVGGVEEAKEDEPFSPLSFPNRNTSLVQHTIQDRQPSDDEDEERESKSFPQQMQQFARSVMVSCGAALSVVSDGCGKWPPNPDDPPPGSVPVRGKAPLSIADDLRKLAVKEGRVFGGGMRQRDIPRFLGEDAVYSFEDDNISAISQNTLEELTRHGVRYPIRRKASSHSSNEQPPTPTRTFSASTGSNEPKTASR